VEHYPDATDILLECDAGGSNNCHHQIFKVDLQQAVNRIGLPIQVAHYPSYCSKYNPTPTCHASLCGSAVRLAADGGEADAEDQYPQRPDDHGPRHPQSLRDRPPVGTRRSGVAQPHPIDPAATMELHHQPTVKKPVIDCQILTVPGTDDPAVEGRPACRRLVCCHGLGDVLELFAGFPENVDRIDSAEIQAS